MLLLAVAFAIDMKEFREQLVRHASNVQAKAPADARSNDIVNVNLQGVPTITFCNTSQTPLTVNWYTISPDNIEPDETVTITVHATLTETVTSGKITVNVKVDKFPVYSATLDLCTEVATIGLTCPLAPQVLYIQETIAIGSIPISGTVDATAQAYDQNNNLLLCMEMVCNV